jgi:hypothetical protein
VKSKILFIVLAMVLVLGISLVGCTGPGGPTAPTSIMIGSCRDTDEGMEVFQCYHGGPAMRWFVNTVNNEDGGIYLSAYNKTVPLELVVREFTVATWDIGTVVQGLIDDGADLILGGPSTDTVYTLAPICNAASVILMSLEGGASKMVWNHTTMIDQWPYVWINLSFANWYEIPVLKGIMDEAVSARDPIAYVTYIGGLGAEHGLEYLQTTIDEFGLNSTIPAGSPPGVVHNFFMSQGDADTVIQNAKTALNQSGNGPDYDIFCAYTYPWNIALLMNSIKTFDFNPPAMVFGPGSSQGYFNLVQGDAVVEGIMSFGTANNKTTASVGTSDMSMATFFSEVGAQIEDDWVHYNTVCPNSYNATHGTQLLDWWGLPIFEAGLTMWKTAVEQTGDLSQATIRAKMAAFNSTNPCHTVFGNTWYHVFGEDPITHLPNNAGGGIVDYLCETGQIGQWQNGVFEIIGFTGINTTNWAAPPSPLTGSNTSLPNYCVTAPYEAMLNNWWWMSH